ncbi:AgmX/PglI C-terminal domain-containing protein [Sorangium sp. So ce1036]|uniref:AgmX/PglI C-terminal domain-containing protein n=1 Tax=Sorangium sp. So ce1036 TaxID=3133328 RepID=UPI003F0E29E8
MTQQQPHPTPSRPGQPGQMTAVMRAIPQATGPKVLRIGLVQGGKVIEERVIKQRTHVTIGPSEKSMFVIPSKSIPPSFRLFELVGGEYFLNFLEGMTGRVAFKAGVSELSALKSSAKRVTVGNTQAFQVQLSEEARGKIVVGETTFLFQFVAPPPVQPKPQLPVSVKSGIASDIDWTTTIIAAFSFLFHFGAVGSIYSDWMDPVVDDEVDVAQLLESVKQLPPPPPVEQPKETVDAPAATAAATVEAPKAASGGSKGGAGSPGKGSGGMSDARASAIANELAQLDVQMLAALNSSGNATSSVLSSGDVPTGLLENAAASGAGVGKGGVAGLNMGSSGGGTVRPGTAGGGGLATIGNTGTSGPATAGSAQAVKGPVGNAQVGGAAVSGGSVSNAPAVVARMTAGFRRCYNKGLQEDPTMKGSVRITARIGPNGEVLSATPSGGSTLSGTVISCVVARVQSAQFAPPEGGGATIVIPVTFVSQ